MQAVCNTLVKNAVKVMSMNVFRAYFKNTRIFYEIILVSRSYGNKNMANMFVLSCFHFFRH